MECPKFSGDAQLAVIEVMTAIDRKWQRLFVVAITVAAGWLRFASINFGLPDQLRPDEDGIVFRALGTPERMIGFAGTCPEAEVFVVRAVYYVDAALRGEGTDLRRAYAGAKVSRAFSIARITTAVMGTATVPIIYMAALAMSGPVAAMVSSSLLAVSFIHVRDSKFAKIEVPAGFWVALTILPMLRIPNRGRMIDYALAGFFSGLVAATHYPSGAIALGIFIAHLEARRREGKSIWGALGDGRIYVAGLLSATAFFVANPTFFLDWGRTIDSYIAIRDAHRMWNGGYSPAGFGWPWVFGLGMPRGFGIEMEIVFLGALLWTAFKPRPGTLALIAFIFVCIWSLTVGRPQLGIRYLINPLIAMVLLAGVFAADVMRFASAKIGTTRALACGALCGIVLLTPSVVRDLQMNRLLYQTDTRTIARRWIMTHIPKGATIGVLGESARAQSYGQPKSLGRRYQLALVGPALTSIDGLTVPAWLILDSSPGLSLWSKGLGDSELAKLSSKATLEFDVDPVRPGTPAPAFDPNDAFYVPFWNINSMSRPGPRIRIWKVTSSLSDNT